MSAARACALEALLHVDENEGYSNIVLDKTLRKSALEERDAALASALFYGVLERRLTLDYLIGKFSRLPVEKLSPPVREILRMGVYQLEYMDKIPESAAVNEAAAMAGAAQGKRAAGFVNAVLRSFLRGRGSIAWPDEAKEPLTALSVRFSCPEWLIALWRRAYGGANAQGLLDALEGAPPVYLRVNNIRTDAEYLRRELEKLSVEAVDAGLENALALKRPGDLIRTEAFARGFFHVQDLSSQICCALVNPRPGERIADVCAAPGGKSFTLAERMENRGEVLSFDLYKGKVKLIREGAARLGLTCISASLRDALKAPAFSPPVDRVLCDAPCSGLGIIRRKPEIRYKSQTSLDSLPDLQYRILCKSSSLVKPGGFLFYSTCTLSPAENAGVADRFLRDNKNFRPAALRLPGGIARVLREPEHQITLMPHAHGTDGFFIASFQKTGES